MRAGNGKPVTKMGDQKGVFLLQFFIFFVPEVIVLKLEFLYTQAQTHTDMEVLGSGSTATLSSWVG